MRKFFINSKTKKCYNANSSRDVNQLTGTTGFVEIGRSYYYTGSSINGIHMSQDDANFYSLPTFVTTGKFRLRKLGNIIYGDYDIGSGWINLGNYSISYNTYIGFAGKVWSYPMEVPADGRWNDLRVRKYLSPEPGVGTTGSEGDGSSSTMFTDFSGTDKTSYNIQENIYVTVVDSDENNNSTLKETVIVAITNNVTGDSEILALIETGNDTGVFRNTRGFFIVTNPNSISNNNRLEVVGMENINVNYIDDDDGGDFSGDIAGIEMGEKNKVVPYNNVFNSKNGERCEIKIELVEDTHVSVKLYTLVGDLVKILVGEDRQAGTEIIYWYGKNDCGDEVASGTYLLRMEAGGFKDTKKICIIK